ncbi:LOW QUALITY PROTEIN: cell death regulator Aven [Pseudoliparis swirei]|uniref:LOW QUALITY PROTEIN: cell death regulator Aven n=1 Tax=Pseudoliparis swirei TaxID=2059687 RepID=UPI0024BD6A4E|nr:LOW QUALITY PROTEIN: cell death regulator Aven [Pseudoliparis swirei]
MLNCPATLTAMEARPSGVRGGSWKRSNRGGTNSDSVGGEHRGRGRGAQQRGRGKRDHYRGRGRGGSGHSAEFHQRQDHDEGGNFHEEDDKVEVFSRRKLASNWDRYEASERKEPDDDMPTQRGTDYHVLLESAGDSFTQFRFSEEKDWETDSSPACQMSAVFVDLPALAQSLQQVPLHQRLNLEAELLQVSTPLELPALTLALKQAKPKAAALTPPSAALKTIIADQEVPVATNPASSADSPGSSVAAEPPVEDGGGGDDDDGDGDEELDQLLSLQKPVWDVSGSQSLRVADEERAPPKETCEQVEETEEAMEEVKDQDVRTPPESTSARQEVTEEDLEDWLDSMIS